MINSRNLATEKSSIGRTIENKKKKKKNDKNSCARKEYAFTFYIVNPYRLPHHIR